MLSLDLNAILKLRKIENEILFLEIYEANAIEWCYVDVANINYLDPNKTVQVLSAY